MTNTASVLRPVSGCELESLRPLLAAAAGPALRLATPILVCANPTAGGPRPTLRDQDLVASLRQARAARFSDRYEWLSLRRRRAQIAARHAVEASE